MKRLFFLACLLGILTGPAQADVVCPHNLFSCLLRHTDAFYLADHDRFYTVYNQAFARAMRCDNYDAVAEYLKMHSTHHDNAEIDESVQEDTEALLLLKPKCFFEGVARLNQEQRDNLLSNYRLFSRPNHVMALLRKFMHAGKYQHIATAIYNANLESYQEYGKDADDAPMDDLYEQYKSH
ncbi:MAG: hypothetical protein GC149_07300 [Gammaproteobacteria bacterium]|nr:hypothetical protein [Gammaproteobacteria bacterium]